MGIFKAVSASVDSMAADQWKEFFYCDAIPEDQIMVRAKRHQSAGSSNKGNPDIITDGSIIAVADGQCAMVVSNGKMIAVYKEPGENVFRSGETAGVFSRSSAGVFGKELMRRISFGGDAPAITQRVYYFNTKVITGIEFGDKREIPISIFDSSRGIDIDCILIISGLYSFRIYDPEKIYKQVIGNVKHIYPVSYLVAHMNADVNNALLSAVRTVTCGKFRSSGLGSFIPELQAKIVEMASNDLRTTKGIELINLTFNSFKLSDKDTGMIREIQLASAAMDPAMAAAMLTDAQADAVRDAANNNL